MIETKPTKARYAQWLKNERGTNVPRLRIVVVNKAGPVVTDYLVLPNPDGHFLVKDDTKAVKDFCYRINNRWQHWTCSCKDYEHGSARADDYQCKHVAGLRAALARRPM